VSGQQPTIRRILLSAAAALTVGLGAVSLVTGFSDQFAVRLLQAVAVFGAGAVVLGGVVVLAMVHLAGWRGEGGEPQSEDDFEALVQRAERLAADGVWAAGDGEYDPSRAGADGESFDVTEDVEFKALVRSAIDELPLEFHRALEHVAVVVSDGGRSRRAYGLYQGDTVARDFFHDRIVIFRDTLVRDFGHDPELLKAQVRRTVRHELAHHLGWDEKGVRGLGL
jgi:predicted Zn-dependent protease with MMP-like domain